MLRSFITFGCFCYLACSAGSLKASSSDTDWLEKAQISWQIPGVVAAIAEKGKSVKVLSVGFCNIEARVPCSSESQFQIGSTTKLFTALLAVDLAAEKKVSLEQSVADFWPEFRLSDERWQKVSIIDLLSHRSGLASVDWPYYWDPSLTRADLIRRVPEIPMDADFRAVWVYSNTNYVLVDEVLKKLTASSWEELLTARLLKPLRMDHASFGKGSDDTRGYAVDELGRASLLPVVPETAQGPAGSLVLSGNEYGKFLKMLVEEGQHSETQVVAPRSLKQIRKIYAPLGYDRRFFEGPSGYALGLFVANYHGDPIYYHPGGRLGFSSYVAWIPGKEVAVAVMTNKNNEHLFPQAIALGLLRRTMGQDADNDMEAWLQMREQAPSTSRASEGSPPTRPLIDYAGVYQNAAWGAFKVTLDKSELGIHYGQLHTALEHRNYDSFSFVSAPGWERIRVRFDANFEGNIDSFILDDGAHPHEYRFKKVK